MTTETKPRLTLYVTRFCSYCRMAERLLDTRGIPYETQSAESPEVREALIQSTGWRAGPIILLGDKLVGGYQELAMLDRSGKLEKMLKGESS